MTNFDPIQGDLQIQVLAALWRLGAGTVEQVRAALPPRYRSAYTTVQTVLTRLVDRELVDRRKEGNAFEYRPRFSEAEYLSRSIAHTLAGASTDARRAAIAQLIGDLPASELDELRRLGQDVDDRRRSA